MKGTSEKPVAHYPLESNITELNELISRNVPPSFGFSTGMIM